MVAKSVIFFANLKFLIPSRVENLRLHILVAAFRVLFLCTFLAEVSQTLLNKVSSLLQEPERQKQKTFEVQKASADELGFKSFAIIHISGILRHGFMYLQQSNGSLVSMFMMMHYTHIYNNTHSNTKR